jgi:hypothetical protein
VKELTPNSRDPFNVFHLKKVESLGKLDDAEARFF